MPSASAPQLPASMGALAALVLVWLAAAVVTAPEAAAIEDPSRPDARVTHGPSCRPGGLVVEVTAGTSPYAVRLATTRAPGGEDEAVLAPGQAVVLRTDDVAPGETIDARLEYEAQDGSADPYADELEEYTFTRPTAEDCGLATAPPTVPEPPPSPSSPEPQPQPQPEPEPEPEPQSEPAPAPTPQPSAPPTRAPSPTPAPVPGAPPSPTAGKRTERAGSAVPAGGSVTVRVEGFAPGERVTFTLHTTGERLTSATADDDGAVTAQVRIPAGTAPGPATLDAQGDRSELVAGVPLQVASAVEDDAAGAGGLVPLLAAAALAATGAATLTAGGRRRSGGR